MIYGDPMVDDLDAETLVRLSLLGEIETQCQWALDRLETIREKVKEVTTTSFVDGNRARWFRARDDTFASVQSFLTGASIVDSIVTGRGPPRPKGMPRVSESTRRWLREQLGVGPDFEIGGRVQRNSLIHIEERLIPWSKPGGMRGDFAITSIGVTDDAVLKQTLRALDPKTLQFAVVGETCSLGEVEKSLILIAEAARRVVRATLDGVNTTSQSSDSSPPS
jgi:hypothetical protein